MTNGNGTVIDANSAMGPFNKYLYSLFSQVEVYLKDTLVIPSINTYPFRAYIATLLNYGIEARDATGESTVEQRHRRARGHDQQNERKVAGSASD